MLEYCHQCSRSLHSRGCIAFTDLVTDDVPTKLKTCLSASPIQTFGVFVCAAIYFRQADWPAMSEVITSRAHSDDQQDSQCHSKREDIFDQSEAFSPRGASKSSLDSEDVQIQLSPLEDYQKQDNTDGPPTMGMIGVTPTQDNNGPPTMGSNESRV